MSDSETLVDDNTKKSEKEPDNDFPSICVELTKKVNFKVAFFMFMLGLFIFSDVFMNNFLSESLHEGGVPNSTGTLVQLTIFVLSYIVIDLLVQGEIL